MSVKIRLARRGRKKRATYDVVVADSRAPRDGRFIEKLGTYNPTVDPAVINIDDNKAFDWVMKGAQPTETVKAMLSYRGVMLKKHLQIGVNKGALTQEDADKKYATWVAEKDTKIQGKVETLAKDKDAKRKAVLAAESKVNKARQEAILARKKVADDALAAEVAEANADTSEVALEQEAADAVADAPKEEAPANEEAKVEAPKEEAPVKEESKVDVPVEETPVKEEAPAKEAPVAEAPEKEETPAKEEPKAETPAEEAPAAEEKKTEE
jgi:small subunit ribosomal protein S16